MTRRDDAGSAALLVTVLAGLLVATAATGAVLGGLVVAQRRAAAAADLAALAGAQSAQGVPAGPVSGHVAACASAASTARANGARLTECTVEGAEILVRAEVDASVGPLIGVLGGRWAVPATARAGPTTSVGPGR